MNHSERLPLLETGIKMSSIEEVIADEEQESGYVGTHRLDT